MALGEDDFKTIAELGDKWPYDWVSVKGLAPYIKRLGENLVGVEIGTCRAESTAYLLDKCPNILKLYTIDPYQAYQDWNGEITQDVLDKFMVIAQKNLAQYGDRVQMIRETSFDAAVKIQTISNKEEFDGHDYSNIQAVNQAVNDFRGKNGITSPINLSTNSTFFWYK